MITIDKPKYCKELAELVGIILGDGSIFVKKYSIKNTVNQIRICGHIQNDRDYLLNFVKPLITNLFKIEPKVKLFKNSAIYICIDSKELVEFVIRIGLKPGNKVLNQVGIPSWIKENKSYTKACIRGLMDTDGSIYELKTHWKGLIQISYKSYSKNLLDDVRNGLLDLGFIVSKTSSNRIYITRKKEIIKFLNEINFNNIKHRIRYNNIALSSSGQL